MEVFKETSQSPSIRKLVYSNVLSKCLLPQNLIYYLHIFKTFGNDTKVLIEMPCMLFFTKIFETHDI